MQAEPQTLEEWKAEAERLKTAIETHRENSRGNGLCWINDVVLWQTVAADASYPIDTLPVREEFLINCALYHESRVKKTPYAEPEPRQTVAPEGTKLTAKDM